LLYDLLYSLYSIFWHEHFGAIYSFWLFAEAVIRQCVISLLYQPTDRTKILSRDCIYPFTRHSVRHNISRSALHGHIYDSSDGYWYFGDLLASFVHRWRQRLDYATAREGQSDRGGRPECQSVEDIEEKWVLFREKQEEVQKIIADGAAKHVKEYASTPS